MGILAIDPSGNHGNEGYGTTGLAHFEEGRIAELNEIKASNFESAEAYWLAHIKQIRHYQPEYVVIEGYRLYHHKGMKAESQANSELETPQLIGCIRLECYARNIPLIFQSASQAKTRWNETVLVRKGILEQKGERYYFNGKQTNSHKRDALKHGLHFIKYGLKELKE